MHTVYPHFSAEHAPAMLSTGGFVIGFIFGAIVIVTNFCTMGAIADIMTQGDYRRLRSWVLAAAVALIGAQALDAAGFVHLDQSAYLRGGLRWFGAIAGGAMFGFGMVLAGGCPSRNIVRAGAGDLRALATLVVVGLFAHTAMNGVLEPAYRLIENHAVAAMPGGIPPSLAHMAAYAAGLESAAKPARIATACMLAGAALLYCFASGPFRGSLRHILAGIAVGGCAIAGWVATTLARDDFALAPLTPGSLSFVHPLAAGIDYVMRPAENAVMDFGVTLIIGVFTGAVAVALITRRFRIQGFAGGADIARNVAGAALMGVGGVLAMGCSIGQGVTGVSTMAADAFIAVAAMAGGAVAGVKYLENSA